VGSGCWRLREPHNRLNPIRSLLVLHVGLGLGLVLGLELLLRAQERRDLEVGGVGQRDGSTKVGRATEHSRNLPRYDLLLHLLS